MISAARLNLRAAPSAAAAILGTLDRGATVDILYRNAANDWWYVCCIAGTDTSGWVSNRFLRSSLDLATARTALSVLASDEVAPPASTRAASSQVAAALAQESAPAGGPTQLVATSATRGRDATYVVGEREDFSWQTDAPLLPGQVFEVVFFGENEGPEAGRATAPASADASAAVPVPAAGRYAWGVWLANAQPYQRLRYLGTGGGIVVTEPGEPREPEPPFDVPQPESPLY